VRQEKKVEDLKKIVRIKNKNLIMEVSKNKGGVKNERTN